MLIYDETAQSCNMEMAGERVIESFGVFAICFEKNIFRHTYRKQFRYRCKRNLMQDSALNW